MKKRSVSLPELIGIVVMVAVVSVLAFLQYRSTREIGQEEERRLKTSLASGVRGFDQEFAYDIERLCESFELDPESPENTLEQRAFRQYESWVQNTTDPRLLDSVELWRIEKNGAPMLEVLNPSNRGFQHAPPKKLNSLDDFVVEQLKQIPSVVSGRDAVYSPWIFDVNGPALVRPVFQMSVSNNVDMQVQPVGILVLKLGQDFLQHEYLPELVKRHFGGSGLGVAIRSAKPPYDALYVSDAAFPIATTSPDAIVNLVDIVADEAKRRGHPPIEADDDASQWQLVVQHPAGSLDIAVSSWRAHNLAISFGLLGVLAAAMALIVSVMRRAEKLANLQMEFVASVSHELCTPLSVINCAAENLADGVVESPREIREYAEIIRDQGRRLEHLVDQSLSIAAGKLGQSRLSLRPVQIPPILSRTIEASAPMLREAAFELKEEIGSDLPLVMADPGAVEKCVENLLSNAV
ncbi:MAG TPA: HAMP domain-containing sensor histidine kinase, partial [Nitrospira sp.]|nr:HAMP domain-containing sensor histidine kinase [Nitrospira sp.]